MEKLKPESATLPGRNVSRRTVMQNAAWSAPVLALAVSTPAAAASSTPTLYTISADVDSLTAVDRCSVVTPGTITFSVFGDGKPAADGTIVAVSIPSGLQFVDAPARTTVELATVAGRISVPAIRATGAVGTYAVTASVQEASAATRVSVLAGAGSSVFIWTQKDQDTPRVSTSTLWPIASIAAVSDNAFAGVGQDGLLRYWGSAFFAKPGDVAAVSGKTGVRMVSLWSTQSSGVGAGYWYVGMLFSNGRDVWYGSTDGQKTLTVATVTGFTGAVQAVETHDNAVYVLTTAGVFYGGPANNGGSMTTVAGPIPGSAGASHLSTWSVKTDKFYTGGAYVTESGAVVSFGANASTPLVAVEVGGAPKDIDELSSSDGALVVHTTSHDVWVTGVAFDAQAWTKLASSILKLSHWGTTLSPLIGGVTRYTGVVMITSAGELVSVLSNDAGVRQTRAVTGFGAAPVVQVAASDGFGQAMDAEGRIWSWSGNADRAMTTPARLVGQPGNTIAMFSHSVHLGMSYYGYGMGIAGAACVV